MVTHKPKLFQQVHGKRGEKRLTVVVETDSSLQGVRSGAPLLRNQEVLLIPRVGIQDLGSSSHHSLPLSSHSS